MRSDIMRRAGRGICFLVSVSCSTSSGAGDGGTGPGSSSGHGGNGTSASGASATGGSSSTSGVGVGGSNVGSGGGATTGAGGGGESGSGGGAGSLDAGQDESGARDSGGPPGSTTGPGVLMRGYDLKRTGANLGEKTLSPANVNMTSFGKLYCSAVDDEIYGQILYVPGVDMGAKGKHDTLYVVTMNDSVYAFDALDPSGKPLWERHYTDPANGIVTVPRTDLGHAGGCSNGYRDISSHVGIMSTPALDVASNTMYVVVRTVENNKYVQRLHALGMIDGVEATGSPATITATYSGTGVGSVNGTITFDPRTQNQRTALLLKEGIVYVAWASHCDEGPYHGWMIGYDAKTLQQSVVYMNTPNGTEGGIWMAGTGPAVDDDGSIFLSTGNGRNTMATPPASDLGFKGGESILRLQRMGGTLNVVDWYTPSTFLTLEATDSDFGGGGVVLVPGSNLLVAASKDGKLYVVDRTKLAHQTTNDSQAIQVIQVTGPIQANRAPHIHGTPTYWKSTAGEFVYVMPEQDPVHQYRINAGKLEPFKTTSIKAPMDPTSTNRFTMPGGFISISANGNDPASGIVWVNMTIDRDANENVVPGVLRAFNASDVSLPELWNSEQNAARDSFGNFAKFNPPTIYNGRVYVPTFSKQFCTYGLLK